MLSLWSHDALVTCTFPICLDTVTSMVPAAFVPSSDNGHVLTATSSPQKQRLICHLEMFLVEEPLFQYQYHLNPPASTRLAFLREDPQCSHNYLQRRDGI